MVFDIWVFGLGNLHYGNNVSFMANMIILLLDHATSPGHHSLVPPARDAVASEFRNWGVDREGSEPNYPRFLRPLAKPGQNLAKRVSMPSEEMQWKNRCAKRSAKNMKRKNNQVRSAAITMHFVWPMPKNVRRVFLN